MLTHLTKRIFCALPAISTRRARRRRVSRSAQPGGIERLELRSLLSATATGLETFASREDLSNFLYGDMQELYKHDFGQPIERMYRINKNGWVSGGDFREFFSTTTSNGVVTLDTATQVSGTNNQVASVDEADQLKSDGQYIYWLTGSDLVIVDSWPVEELSVVSRTRIDGKPLVQFLDGDRLMVISSHDGYDGESPLWRSRVQVTVLDVSDRAHPEVIDETRLDGEFQRALMVGSQVQVAVKNSISTRIWNGFYPIWHTNDGLRALPVSDTIISLTSNTPAPTVDMVSGAFTSFGMPIFAPPVSPWDPQRTMVETRTEFEDYTEVKTVTTFESWDDYNTRVFRGSDPLDLVFPGRFQRSGAAGAEWLRTGLVSDADDIVRPPNRDVLNNMVTVATFHLDAAEPATSVDTASIFTGWQTFIYQSQDHLYVTNTEHNSSEKTVVHQFLVEPTQITVTARGEVPGAALNQFSMDEYAGHFRIATNYWNQGLKNNLFVLDTEGETLDITGQVIDLAPGERITSARFLGDRGYVVTFRQTDPLFVFDLSNPTDPQLLGELVIPGFSEYLHPLGTDYLIGIGQDGTWSGGLQVSLFDVSAGHEPKLIHRQDVTASAGWWSDWNRTDIGGWQFDHHAVSFFADEGILAIPYRHQVSYLLRDLGYSGNRLLVLHVDKTGIQKLGEIEHDHPIQRSLRIGDGLYSVSDNTIKVHALNDPFLQLGEVSLDPQVDPDLRHPVNLYTWPLTPNSGFGSKIEDLFDESYYARINSDVAAAITGGGFQSGYEHYLQYGQQEGRNPNAFFNESHYLTSNPDVNRVVEAGGLASGFEHFIRYGQFELRSPSLSFDDTYYLGQYADVRAAVLNGGFASGFAHMVEYGQNEGRSPNAFYSETEYLEANSDVAAAVTQGVFDCGLQHYLQYGLLEGRHASDYFNEAAYLTQNPDVAAAVAAGGFSSGIEHFLEYGRKEHRAVPLTTSEINELDDLFSDQNWFYTMLGIP